MSSSYCGVIPKFNCKISIPCWQNQKPFIIVALVFKLALIVHRYCSPLEDMKRRFVFQSQIWQAGAEFSLMVTCVWCLWLSIASIILPRQMSCVYNICDYRFASIFLPRRMFQASDIEMTLCIQCLISSLSSSVSTLIRPIR